MSHSEKDERYYRAVLEHKSVSRRGLFRGLFSGVSATGKQAKKEDEARLVPRPPGSAEESIFSKLCTQGCNQCEQVCPQQVISMVDGLPELGLDYNSCSECGECARICPTLAISAHSIGTGAMPRISSNCLRRMSPSCEECVEMCSHDALSLLDREVELNPDACSGCGQCREACPSMAIDMIMKG